jgi:hypothetical protein
VKAVKMKALSPFLPDVPTLASLFAGAGIVSSPESSERERAPSRPATGARPPASARAPAPAASASPAASAQIRFPVSTVTAPIPSKGPLRAAIPATIPPIEPANGSGVHAIAPAHIPPRVSTTAAPAAATRPVEPINDEAALHHIFGNRDRSAPPLQQRFEAFVDWLGTGVGSQGSFVADADGLILASRGAPDTYAVATVSLCHAEQSVLDYMPRPPEGTTTLELDDTRFLQVIRVETVVGRLIIGIIVAAPLSRTVCTMVRRLMKIGVEWEAVR